MENEELERFIELLNKLKDNQDDLTWREMNELRSFSYSFGDFITR